MTIGEAIARAAELKPNAVSRETQVRWLSDVDATIVQQIVHTHRHGADLVFEGYDPAAAENEKGHCTDATLLLVPEPYSRLYLYWLCSQMDLCNQEFDLYAGNAALYNRAYADYRNFYNRQIQPLQPATLGQGGVL